MQRVSATRTTPHLQVDRPRAGTGSPTFTAHDLAACSRFTHDQAELFLVDFAATGVLEAAGQGYRFTRRGLRTARLLAQVMP